MMPSPMGAGAPSPPGMPPPGIAGPMGPPPGPGTSPGGPSTTAASLLAPDETGQFLSTIDQMVATQGEDKVRDMLSALPPEVLDTLYRLVEDDVRAAIVLGDLLDPPERTPQYEPWYEEPPKPTRAEIMDAARLDKGLWADRVAVMRDDIQWYMGEHPNVFPGFVKDKESYYYDPAIRDDSDAKISILGNAPVNFEICYTEIEFEEPTQKAENALYYWMACWSAQYARANAGRSLRHDIEWYREVCGWIFCEVTPNLSGGKPLISKLYDPMTCYPSWDEHGLHHLSRIYSDSVTNVIAAYDDEKHSVRKAILSKVVITDLKGERLAQTHDQVTVTAYVDRAWRALYVNDVEILPPTKHAYGICPVVIGGSGLGEPMALAGDAATASGFDPIGSHSASRLKYKNPSGFNHRKRAHAQKEAVKTKLFNLVNRIDRPDYTIEQDEYAEGEGTPQIKHGGLAITPLKAGHEKLNPLLNVAPPDLFSPIFAQMSQEDLTGRLPLAQHGVAQSAAESGSSTEGHIEAGKDKFSVQLQAAEVFWGEWASLNLRLYRDIGHLIPDERGMYGRQKVPYGGKDRWKYPGRPPAYEITPEMLDHIGTEVTAELTSVRLQNLAPLGNAVAIWKAQRGMSSREGMELRGVRDPDKIFDEMDYEDALADPDVQQIKRLMVMRKRNPELAALYEQKIMGTPPPGASGPPGSPPNGPPSGPQNGMQPPGVPVSPNPNTSAMDLSPLGLGNGGAGRPALPPQAGIGV
jgi:hypothetical protein